MLEVSASGSVVRADDRARLWMAILGSALIASMRDFDSALAALLVTLLVACTAIFVPKMSLPPLLVGRAVRRLLQINLLSIFIWLTLPWGWTISQGWSWQPEMAAQAAVVTLRLNAIVLWCLVWLSQMEPQVLASSFRALGAPARLALLLYLTLRLLETLSRSRQRLQRAMLARGSAHSLLRRMQGAAQLLVLLIAEGVRRADIFVAALRARGLDLHSPHFYLPSSVAQPLPWRQRWAFTGAIVLLLVAGWGL